MKKGTKIALIVAAVLITGGLVYWAISSKSKKSGVEEKDSRRITLKKV